MVWLADICNRWSQKKLEVIKRGPLIIQYTPPQSWQGRLRLTFYKAQFLGKKNASLEEMEDQNTEKKMHFWLEPT